MPIEPSSDDDTDEYESESSLTSPEASSEVDTPADTLELIQNSSDLLDEIFGSTPEDSDSTKQINSRKKSEATIDDETYAQIAFATEKLDDIFPPDSNDPETEETGDQNDSDYSPNEAEVESEDENVPIEKSDEDSEEDSTLDSSSSDGTISSPKIKKMKRNLKLTEKAKETDDVNLFQRLRRDRKYKKRKRSTRSKSDKSRDVSPKKERIILKISKNRIADEVTVTNKRTRSVSTEKSLKSS